MIIRVGIGLGSNLGDRLANLCRARELILLLPGIVAASRLTPVAPPCLSAPVFETDPVDCPADAAPFFNTVVEVGLHARCSPMQFLTGLRQIEKTLGRPTRYPRNSPRCIDLDILYAGQLTMATSELRLPHPRLHTRRFVLAPLASIRPDLVLPGRQIPVSDLLQQLDDPARVEPVHASW